MAMELWAGRYNQCSDNVMDRINLDYVKRNCTFGDVGQLNLAFRDFNSSWRTEVGYTKNFSFKPWTVNIIKDIMTHSLYLQDTQKKAMKTIWNNYTDQRWQMNRLRDDYNRLNDKLIQLSEVDISGRAKEKIYNTVNSKVNRLVKYKFQKLMLEDTLNNGIRNPELWIRDTFVFLDNYISVLNEELEDVR